MLFPLRSLASLRLIRRLALLLSLSLAFSAPLSAQSTNTATATAGAASASQSATSDPSLPPPAGAPLPPLPERDEDQDGLTYAEEKQRGSDPTKPDTDGDGVDDSEDGWPSHDWITAPPLPEVRYAALTLASLGWPAGYNAITLNDEFQIIGYRGETVSDCSPVILTAPGAAIQNLVTGTWYSQSPYGPNPRPDPYPPGLGSRNYSLISHVRYLALLNTFGSSNRGSYRLAESGSLLISEGLGADSRRVRVRKPDGTSHLLPLKDGLFDAVPYPPIFYQVQSAFPVDINKRGDVLTFEFGWAGTSLANYSVNGVNNQVWTATLCYGLALHRTDGASEWVGGVEQCTYGPAVPSPDFFRSGSPGLYPTKKSPAWFVMNYFIGSNVLNELGMVSGVTTPSPDSSDWDLAIWEASSIKSLGWFGTVTSNPPPPSDNRLTDGGDGYPVVCSFKPAPGSTTGSINYLQNGQWKSSLPRIWNPTTQSLRNGYNDIARLNNRLESPYVRNGVYREPSSYLPAGWRTFTPFDMNNHGGMIGICYRTIDDQGQPIPDASQVPEHSLLFPFELTSEDRLLKGSLRIPEGWSDVSLSFRSTADNGLDLGTFAKLEPGAADSPTYIYASETDVLSDDEFEQAQDGTLDPRAASQPVVFYRDTEDPRRLHFATAFDQAGEIEIALTFGPAAQRVTAKLTHTLVAQTEAAGLIATLDQRIESIDIPEVIDFDPDLDGDGIPDGGSIDLIVASQPGTPSAPGPSVSEQDENDPDNLVLLANTDDDDFDGVADHLHTTLAAGDDDLARIVLRAPADLATAAGKLTLTHTGGAALRLRLDTGPPVSSGASVDLAAPAGPLAQLSVGLPLVLYAEGLAPASDLTITLAYTPVGQSLPTVTDTVHLHVVDPDGLAALQNRHRYFVRPGDLGGIFARSYAVNGAYRQHRLGLAPIGENQPLQNRGLLAKALLPVIGNLKITAAYYRGAADGFWMGIKSDWQGLQDVGGAVGSVLAFYFVEDNAGRIARVKALADQLREIKQAFDGVALRDLPGIMKQMATTITRDLYTDAEAALGWEPIIPGLDPQVVAYMAGVTTGFVGEQVLVALIPGGAATKIGPVLRQVVLAVKSGTRFILPALEASSKAGTWVYRSIQKILGSTDEARDAWHGVKKAKEAPLPTGRVNPVVTMSNRLRTRPELFDEILDIWNEWLPRPVNAEQVTALTNNYARLVELAPGPTDLSDDALKGWARFYGSIGINTPSNSTRYTEDLVKVFGGAGSFDKAGFNAVMKQLSDVGHNGFKLTLEAGSATRWRLTGTDIFFDRLSPNSQGHSLTHVFTHTVANFKQGAHSVFTTPREHLLELIKNCWANKTISHPSDLFRWEVETGGIIGSMGETKIRIIVNPTTKQIISAYPILNTESYL